MMLVFPISIHTIETINGIIHVHFTYTSPKKGKEVKHYVTMVTNYWVKRLTMEHIWCKNNVGVYMYTITLIIIKCII